MVATRLQTVEDVERMPGDEPWELWEGELREVPSSTIEVSGFAGWICALLWMFVGPRNLGWITSPDGTFVLARDPDTVVVPDVAFIRWEHLPGRVAPNRYTLVVPDLAVEVISPSNTPGKRAEKQALYDRAGVPLVWWVEPVGRRVAVYRDGVLVADLGEGDELDGGDVLPGFRLAVGRIFAPGSF